MSATTEESTTTPNDSASKSRRISSRREEHAGDRGVEGRRDAAAAPQATRIRSRDSGTRVELAERRAERRADLHDRPLAATEPPEPMQSAEASDLTTATCGRIRPPRSATASITSGTPWPRASRAKQSISGPYSRPPMTGARHDEPEPDTVEVAVRRVPGRAVVAMTAERVGEAEDQVTESDRTSTGPAPTTSASATSPPEVARNHQCARASRPRPTVTIRPTLIAEPRRSGRSKRAHRRADQRPTSCWLCTNARKLDPTALIASASWRRSSRRPMNAL